MVMLETYYHLADRDINRVSCFWKAGHIAFLIIIAFSGFITAYTFGIAVDAFGDHCILFGNISLKEFNISQDLPISVPILISENNSVLNNSTNEVRKVISLQNTVWGSDELCSFCQFTPIMSMIFGTTWAVFFMVCTKGGSGYPSDIMTRPWRIVYPALFFSIIFACILLASTLQLRSGIKNFCSQLFEDPDGSCTSEMNEFTLSFHKAKYNAYTYLQVSFAFGHIGLIMWFAQIGLLLLRVLCVTDFQLYIVSVVQKQEDTTDSGSPADGEYPSTSTTFTSVRERGAETDDSMKKDKRKSVLFADGIPTGKDDESVENISLASRDTNIRAGETSQETHSDTTFGS